MRYFYQSKITAEGDIKLEPEKKLLFGSCDIQKGINLIVGKITTEFRNISLNDIALIAIQPRGVIFTQRLHQAIERKTGGSPAFGTIDITMYRDDIGKRKTLPVIHETNIPFDLDDKVVILVDDVLHTGRTIRAALDALTYYGRPAMIRLAVLFDRGEREFPIQADYSGFTNKLPPGKKLRIEFGDLPEQDAIYEIKKIKK